MNRRRYHLLDFAAEVNAAVVGDLAKLIVHRLVARRMRRDSSLVERAKKIQASMAEQYGGWPFIAEWNELLAMPPAALRAKLVSRDREMVRLRNTSPFYLAEAIDFGDYDHRIRIARAARRIAQRSMGGRPRGNLRAAGAKIGSPRAGNPTLRYTSDIACDCSVEKLTSQRGAPAHQLRCPRPVHRTGTSRPTRGCGLHQFRPLRHFRRPQWPPEIRRRAPAQISHQRASESKG
jgi:hypothetical protein